jgi:hypothetical protein
MKLKPGQSADPLPRLSPDELREELIAENKRLPVYLVEDDYREWLDHTVMARTQRGEEALDKAREALKELAARNPDSGEDVELVLSEIDQAVVAFQYGVLKFNVMFRPTIDGRDAANVVLWPLGEVGTVQ